MLSIPLAQRFGSSLLDPDGGRELHDVIAAALEKGEAVSLDFDGVGPVISAFFNPAVGELYKEFEPDVLSASLKITNYTPVHAKVLSTVIDNAKRHAFNHAYQAAEQAALDVIRREL